MRLLHPRICGPAIVALSLTIPAIPVSAQPPEPTSSVGQASAPPAPTGPLMEDSRSLFAPTWNTFTLAGRVSSISGDPARFQRYEDIRDGLLFTGGRVLRETPDFTVKAGADNLGWRDQRYFGNYERTGKFKVFGMWDEIPQFYSVDTQTAYTSSGEGVLVLDDNLQRQANLNAYRDTSPQFDLRERRDIGTFRASATPTTALDITGGFTTTKHSGELPWGASFGFSNDNEVGLPYNSRTNDFDVGAQWTNQRAMVRAAYTGSWFNNLDDTLTWDNPLVLNDTTSAPGHGRMALWPSNSYQTLSTAGYAKFAHKTQLTGSLAFGWADNSEPLLPFTVNSALTQIPLPRTNTDASASTIATTINLVSRPIDDWRFNTRFRRFDYNNDMPVTPVTNYVSYDSSVNTSTTGGPEIYAHNRNTLDAEATWTGLQPVALTFGYTNNHNGYDFRIFESSNENVLHLKADAVGISGLNFRAHYEYGSRSGSGLNEDLLVEIGEQPTMRHYDLADRTRNRFVGQVDAMPTEALTLSFSAGFGKDDFKDSGFGLQEATFRNITLAADYQTPNGIVFGGTYDYERYFGNQQSRSTSASAFTDPAGNWTVDSTENVHYFSIYVKPPRFGKTETRFSYDYSHARGDYFYVVGPALPAPSQLPQTFNKLQDFRADVRHRISGRLAGTLSYVYEPYRIFDFAFDPSVINGPVQTKTLILNYQYRPYTAHTAVFGIQYFW